VPGRLAPEPFGLAVELGPLVSAKPLLLIVACHRATSILARHVSALVARNSDDVSRAGVKRVRNVRAEIGAHCQTL
jgi:hypothetical protein